MRKANHRPELEMLRHELNLIQDAEVRDYVERFLDHAPDRMWVMPALTPDRDHSGLLLGPCGQVIHIKRAVFLANHLCRAYDVQGLDRDLVLAGTILHDVDKTLPGFGGPMDENTHGQNSASIYWDPCNPELFPSRPLDGPKGMERLHIITTIDNCIRYHMGRWTSPRVRKPLSEYTRIELIVHLSDYLSACDDVGTPVDVLAPEYASKCKKMT